MEKLKTLALSRLTMFIGGAVLALLVAWPLMGAAQDKADKAKDPDAHAQHKDKQPAGDQTLASQIAELRAKVEKLEVALKQDHKGTPSGTPDKGGLADKQDKTGGSPPGDRVAAKFQNCIQCHQTRPSGPLPASHLDKAGDKDVGTNDVGKEGMGDNKKSAGGMGMMEDKKKAGMGMMEDKKKAGMGMMDMADKKGMGAMGAGKAGMGSSTTEMMDQQMMQMMQMMLEMRMMEMKMKMMDKGMGTEADKTDKPDPHATHKP